MKKVLALFSILLACSSNIYSLTSSQKKLVTDFIGIILLAPVEKYEQEEKKIRAQAESAHPIHDKYSEKTKEFIQQETHKLKTVFAKTLKEELLRSSDAQLTEESLYKLITKSQEFADFRNNLNLFEKQLNEMLKEWKSEALTHDTEAFFNEFLMETQPAPEQETQELFENLFDESEKACIQKYMEKFNLSQSPFSPGKADHSCSKAIPVHTKYAKELLDIYSIEAPKLKQVLLQSLAAWKQANLNNNVTESTLRNLIQNDSSYIKEFIKQQGEFTKRMMTLELNWTTEGYEYCLAHAQTASERVAAAKRLDDWSREKAETQLLLENLEVFISLGRLFKNGR